MGFDKGIDYISHSNALPWVLIRELIIFLIVLHCAMGFDKGIDYISHSNALQWVLIRELIIFLIDIYMFVVSGHLYRLLPSSQPCGLKVKIKDGFGTHPPTFLGAGLSILVFL